MKWSILIPALVLISLSGYYIATQPEETTISATLITPVEVSTTEDVPVDEPEPQIEPQPEPIQPTQEEAPAEAPETEEPTPEEPETDSQASEETTQEEAFDDESPQEEESQPPAQEEEPEVEESVPEAEEETTTALTPQPLDSDIYSLSGSYISDQGVTVDIQFTDGFYRISLQGMSDSHHTITELSPPSGNTLDLSITLTNLPFTITLSRSEDGTLSIAAYMAGSTAPMLSATATKAE